MDAYDVVALLISIVAFNDDGNFIAKTASLSTVPREGRGFLQESGRCVRSRHDRQNAQ
jgi:hypothetical protein